MKKNSVLGILAGLVLVAVLWYFVVRRPAVRLSAATLAPAESLAFFYLPDIQRSIQRWDGTSVHAMLDEPEVKAFLGSASRESGRIGMAKSYGQRVATTKPREAFLSIESVEGSKPRFVAGLRYEGDRAKVEALVQEANEALRKLVPTGTADLVQRGSKTIETFTSDKVTLAATWHEDWYLVGSGVPEIEETLIRFRGDAQSSLAGSEAYRSATEHLPEDYDSLIFVQPASLAERLSGVLGVAGMEAQSEKLAQLKRLKAVAASTKMDGKMMRDSVFTLIPEMPETAALSGATLPFASPAALIYYAAALQPMPAESTGGPDSAPGLGMIPLVAMIESRLASQGVTAADLPKAIGPEIGFSLEWPAEGGRPRPMLATEVRDRALLQKFIDAALDPSLSGLSASQIKENDVTFYTMPAQAFGTPTLLLTDKLMAIGLDKSALQAALAGRETLAGTPAYRETMGLLEKPTVSTGYVDARAMFERIYGTVRPMLIMMAAFGQQPGVQVDFGKLPEAETVSRHLGPIGISQTALKDGILLESAGAVTLPQALIGTGGAVVWLAGPLIGGRLQQGLQSLSGGALLPGAAPGISPPPPAAPASTPPVSSEPDATATPLSTPGYVSPVPGTVQDESVNPPLSDPTPATTPPGIEPETILPSREGWSGQGINVPDGAPAPAAPVASPEA